MSDDTVQVTPENIDFLKSVFVDIAHMLKPGFTVHVNWRMTEWLRQELARLDSERVRH